MTPEQRLKRIAKVFDTTRRNKQGLDVSSHAYYNLEAVIQEIEHTGKCDAISLRTLKRVRDQIGRIYQLLPH